MCCFCHNIDAAPGWSISRIRLVGYFGCLGYPGADPGRFPDMFKLHRNIAYEGHSCSIDSVVGSDVGSFLCVGGDPIPVKIDEICAAT